MVLATLALALVFGAAGVGLAAAQPPPLPSGPDTCRSGFVWREATPADHVCIQQGPGLPDVRKQIQEENAAAAENRAGKGRLGPDTCKSGFVWRETTPVDHVCVSPQRRDEVKEENGNAIINMLYPPAQPSRGLVARQGAKVMQSTPR